MSHLLVMSVSGIRGHWTDAGLAHRSPVTPTFAFVRGELTKGGRIAKVAEALVTKKQGLKWSKWPDCKSRARCWRRSNFTIFVLLVFNMHYMGPLWGVWYKQKRQTCQQRQVLFRAVNGCFGAELYVQCTKPDKESSRRISQFHFHIHQVKHNETAQFT